MIKIMIKDDGPSRNRNEKRKGFRLAGTQGLAHQAPQKDLAVHQGSLPDSRGTLAPSGTLAWCRSTPYMESFLAFSRKWISASPGVMPLRERK